MRSVARLRRWLLGGVILLLLVLAGLLGYARYRAHRFMADLPHRLGIDIKSETNGFTASRSVKGRTLYTVHASKAVQRENGKTTLHDVAITLYGPPGSKETDSIRGDEFEYDEPNGVVRATGIVHLDLAAPAGNNATPKPGAQRIAVTTSGLVFLQKFGVAATDEPIHIVYGDMRAEANGADYESDTGLLRLRRNVRMDGTQGGQVMHVDANAAELDRSSQKTTLHTAHIRTEKSRAAGDLVTLMLAKGGGIQSVRAEGHASIEDAAGLHAESPHMVAVLNLSGKLETATMSGGVKLQDEGGTGSAADALVHFDAAGQPVQIDLQHAVRLETMAATGPSHSTLAAERVVAHLVQNGRRAELHDAVATGNAVLRSVEAVSQQAPAQTGSPRRATTRTTVVSALTLHAVTSGSGSERYVSSLDGTGGTRIDETDDTGSARTSTGDTLHATLLAPKTGAKGAGTGALQAAVQTGHVVVTQHTPAAARASGQAVPPQDSRATANRAEFDSATQRLVLTGSPVVTGPGVQLAADRVALAQGSGDAEAQGTIKGTFVQEAPAGTKGGPNSAVSDPVHVLADHATIAGSGGAARFFGGAKPARMWSSTAQIDAPELDLDRANGTLAAHRSTQVAGAPAVHLVLPAGAGSAGGSAGRDTGPVQITGQDLLITPATAKAPGHIDISNDVRVVSAGSDLKANRVVATLKTSSNPDPPGKGKDSAGALGGGSIESILATGSVHLQQPGRTGTGERLLYTAADGRYELTGTPATPPSILDSLRGTITGTSLIFHGSDDSVEVAGEPGKRVHTETHAARPVRSR